MMIKIIFNIFFSLSTQSNENIVSFCKLKDNTIEEKYNNADESKESYKQLLNENLAKEKKLREKK